MKEKEDGSRKQKEGRPENAALAAKILQRTI
jgi:hypothetical protein